MNKILAGIGILFFISIAVFILPFFLPTANANFIVASPVNLSQISQISKFRSCRGHDYSGYDANGTLETNRSMKHYFSPIPQYNGSTNQVQEFAPFNGTVVAIIKEHHPYGRQVWIADTPPPAFLVSNNSNMLPNIWTMVFFHMNPISSLRVGSKVNSGELIGHANLTANEQLDFDIALTKFGFSGGHIGQILDSPFNHMGQNVLAQFEAHGINQTNIIIPKTYRDSNPCNFAENMLGENPNDSVVVIH